MRKICLDISTACPAKCRYCLHQYRELVKPRFIQMDVFEKILGILKREGFRYVYPYLSGEPTIHPAFWVILKSLSTAGITTNTATKLPVMIDPGEISNVLSAANAPIHFEVTIDAVTQQAQDKISCGTMKTETIWENLKNLTTIAAKYRHLSSVSVITVHNRFNEGEINFIRRKASSLGAKWSFKPMGFYMGYMMDQEDLKNIKELSPRYGSPRFTISAGKIKSPMRECQYLKPVIGPEGQVSICCHDMLYAQSQWNVLEKNSLKFIIESMEYRDMEREGHFMRLPICKGCN